MYANYYEIQVSTQRSGDNEWYEKKLIKKGFVEQDLYQEMERQFKALKDINIHVDVTGESEDTSFNEGTDRPF